MIEQRFVIDDVGEITHSLSGGPGIFTSCDLNGTIMPITSSSLYRVTVILSTCTSGGGLANGTYTGLATSRTQTDPDDILVFAVSNGLYSPNADFE